MKIFKILVLLVLIFGIFCTGCTDVQKKFSRDINKTNNAIFTPSIKAFNSALSLDAEGVKSNAVKLSQGMQKKQNTTLKEFHSCYLSAYGKYSWSVSLIND
jgi:hypothetical protein